MPFVKSSGVWKRAKSSVKASGVWQDQDVFRTDFREYGTGGAPNDWTAQDTSAGSGSIVTSAGSLSGNAFRFTNLNAGSGRIVYSWNIVPSNSDFEILIRARQFSASGDTKPITGIFGRGSGAGMSAYWRMETRYRTASAFDTLAMLINTAGGTAAQTDGPSPLYSGTAPTAWLWNRFRCNGTTIQGRSWQDGSAEPGTWLMSITDSNVPGPGLAGLIYTANNAVPSIDVDFFSIALNGKTALGP